MKSSLLVKGPLWVKACILVSVIICIYLIYNVLLDILDYIWYGYYASKSMIGAEDYDYPYKPLSHFKGAVNNLFNLFNTIAIKVLNFGHIILFCMYFFMGIRLFQKSKKNVFNAQMQGIGESFVKKKGMDVSCILVLVGFGFLTGLLTKVLLIILKSSPDSPFLNIINNYPYYEGESFDKFVYWVLCLGSFLGFVILSYGCYILLYGTILKYKSRPAGYIILGLVLVGFFGITSFLKVLNSIF